MKQGTQFLVFPDLGILIHEQITSWENKMYFYFKKDRQHFFLQQLLIVAFVLFYVRFRDRTSRSLSHTRLKNMRHVLTAQRL